MERLVNKVEIILSKMEVVFAYGVALLLLFCMFFISSEVAARYAFRSPIPGVVELVELLMIPIGLLALAYTQQMKSHIRVDLLLRRQTGKRHDAVECAIRGAEFVVCVAVLIGVSMHFADAYRLQEETLGQVMLSFWPFYIWACVGFLLLSFRFILEFVQHLSAVIRNGRR